MAIYRIKHDGEVNDRPQPYEEGKYSGVRYGLPSTVRVQGGKSFVILSDAWMRYVWNINTEAGRRYMWVKDSQTILDDSIGWHNQGKPNRVEQITCSLNQVNVTSIEGNKAYVECCYNNEAPPVGMDYPWVQLITTQFGKEKCDISTNGRYPRILLIANDRNERLWIDIKELELVQPETQPENEGTMSEYQIILDAWEGSGDMDEPLLVSENASAMISRINSMAGGHHDDDTFASQWIQNKVFPLRSIYFVYNPWVNGLANWQWLQPKIPSDCPKRIFIDVEVKYPNYSTSTYAKEVDTFLTKCDQAGYWPCIYTGYGYLELMNPWPNTRDYWWARYLYATMPSRTPHTWDDLKAKLEATDFNDSDYFSSKHVCPGFVKLWQVSGDKWILPGCAGHAMDISIWNGDLASLKEWWGVGEEEPEEPEPPSTEDRLPAFLTELDALRAKYK